MLCPCRVPVTRQVKEKTEIFRLAGSTVFLLSAQVVELCLPGRAALQHQRIDAAEAISGAPQAPALAGRGRRLASGRLKRQLRAVNRGPTIKPQNPRLQLYTRKAVTLQAMLSGSGPASCSRGTHRHPGVPAEEGSIMPA